MKQLQFSRKKGQATNFLTPLYLWIFHNKVGLKKSIFAKFRTFFHRMRMANDYHIRGSFWQHWKKCDKLTLNALLLSLSSCSFGLINVIQLPVAAEINFMEQWGMKLTWKGVWFPSFGLLAEFTAWRKFQQLWNITQHPSRIMLCEVKLSILLQLIGQAGRSLKQWSFQFQGNWQRDIHINLHFIHDKDRVDDQTQMGILP
jgi:hypothetical protein